VGLQDPLLRTDRGVKLGGTQESVKGGK
jgi:hypothetical protein